MHVDQLQLHEHDGRLALAKIQYSEFLKSLMLLTLMLRNTNAILRGSSCVEE